jgi:hypothetical protein
MGETPEWDAISARFCKLEMPTAGEVMDLFGAYGKLLIERDALAAELATVRAGLPRWRKGDYMWALKFTNVKRDDSLGTVTEDADNDMPWYSYNGTTGEAFATREYAFRDIEHGYGLPPCEVEGE